MVGGGAGPRAGPGAFGENLTTEGVDVSGAVIGERWRIGDVELEVCQPRQPCAKLGLRFGDLTMVKRFAQARRPGAYLRIVREGELGAGDAIEVARRPEHGVTIRLVADALLLDDALLAAPPPRRSSRPTWPTGCGPRGMSTAAGREQGADGSGARSAGAQRGSGARARRGRRVRDRVGACPKPA